MSFDYATFNKLVGAYNSSYQRTIPNYSLKSNILKKELNILIGNINYQNYLNLYNSVHDFDDHQLCFSKNYLDEVFNKIAYEYGYNVILECNRINNARYHKIARLKYRVGKIIKKRSFFLTLTFTDESLKKKDSTLRKYVTRYLKSISNNYVANVDYGAKFGRLHYHALVQCEHIDYRLWRYGALNFEEVRINNDSSNEKLSKYIAKLSNHAIKETASRQALIYPKKTSPVSKKVNY